MMVPGSVEWQSTAAIICRIRMQKPQMQSNEVKQNLLLIANYAHTSEVGNGGSVDS